MSETDAEAAKRARAVERVRKWQLANPEKVAAYRAKARKPPRPPSPRALAKAAGESQYDTGKPCSQGHLAPRYVSTKKCVVCTKIKAAAKYERTKEAVQAKNRAYYAANREAIRAQVREYNARRSAENVARTKRWRAENPIAAKASRTRRKARIRGATGTHTASDIAALFKLQRGKCADCRKSVRHCYHVDHIMPIALGGSNEPRNLQILCPSCNTRKNAKHPLDWARQNGRLV